MSGINRETDESATLQIGQTEHGMVRLYVVTDRFDIPMDFTAEEAREIANEILTHVETLKTN